MFSSLLQGRPPGQMPGAHTPQMPPNQNYGPAGFSPIFAAGPGAASGQSLTCQGPIPPNPGSPVNHQSHHSNQQQHSVSHSPPTSQPHSPGAYPQHWAAPQMSPNVHRQPPPVQEHQHQRHPSPARSPPARSPSQQCKHLYQILFSIFDQNFDFRSKFRFSIKISIFDQNLGFWTNFRFWSNISNFDRNFDFQQDFCFLTENVDFDPNFRFSPKF